MHSPQFLNVSEKFMMKEGLRMYQSKSNILCFTYVQHSKLLSADLAKTGDFKRIQRF